MSFEDGIVPKIKYKKSESWHLVFSKILQGLISGLCRELKLYLDTEVFFDFNRLPEDELYILNAEIAKIRKEYEGLLTEADIYILKKELAQELLAGRHTCSASLKQRAFMIYARRSMCI